MFPIEFLLKFGCMHERRAVAFCVLTRTQDSVLARSIRQESSYRECITKRLVRLVYNAQVLACMDIMCCATASFWPRVLFDIIDRNA